MKTDQNTQNQVNEDSDKNEDEDDLKSMESLGSEESIDVEIDLDSDEDDFDDADSDDIDDDMDEDDGIDSDADSSETDTETNTTQYRLDMTDFIHVLADELSFPSSAKKEDFVADLVGIFVEDLVAGLYELSEFAEILELFEEELDNYTHHDDVLKATSRLLGKIPEAKRYKMITDSYQKTADRVLRKMVEKGDLKEAQVKLIWEKDAEVRKAKDLAAKAKSQLGDTSGDADAQSALEGLAGK